jgi:tetratricopeptide (TPR) repeat protein
MGRAYSLYVWSEFTTRADGDDSVLASLAAFRRAVALNPRNDEAWHQFGSSLQLVSDSASLDALRRALALDPARAVSYLGLSITYHLMGRVNRALETIDSALAIDPDGPYRLWRVLYRITAGDTAGAVADAVRTPGLSLGPVAALDAVGRDSVAIRQMEGRPRSHCDAATAMYGLWTGRREQAVQSFLRCGPSLWTRLYLRMLALSPLADDPRIQALRAESDRILARAQWR